MSNDHEGGDLRIDEKCRQRLWEISIEIADTLLNALEASNE